MEAKILAYNMGPTLASAHCNKMDKRKPENLSVVAMLTRPSDDIAAGETRRTNNYVYKDNWFDRLAINHLSKCVQEATGLRNSKSGYQSLVEAATVASQKFNPIQQQEVIIQALNRALPKPMFSLIRTMLPPSKFSRETFAAFTTWVFPWLVGPCEVRESEVNGRREKNVVRIRKCRFLEETECVGMCINLCKIPTQSVIKDSMGMPLNMAPNFDDMSCEMIFGQNPPAPTDDPALKQPCYNLCKAKKKHETNCLS